MVSIVTFLPNGWSWVQILVGTTDSSLLQNIETSCGAHPVFCIMVPGLKRPEHEVNY